MSKRKESSPHFMTAKFLCFLHYLHDYVNYSLVSFSQPLDLRLKNLRKIEIFSSDA